MLKISITINNKVDFQHFLKKYVMDRNPKKGAFWNGVVNNEFFRIQRLKSRTNYGRPQIIGLFLGKSQLELSIRMNYRVMRLVLVVSILLMLVGVFTLNLNLIFLAPIVGLFIYMIGRVFFFFERKEAVKDLEVLSKIAACYSLDEMETFVRSLMTEQGK